MCHLSILLPQPKSHWEDYSKTYRAVMEIFQCFNAQEVHLMENSKIE
jgi:hypothetical protein